MARVSILPVATFVDPVDYTLTSAVGATVTVKLRNTDGTSGANATVYSGPTGLGVVSQPITIPVDGHINGWVVPGRYNLVFTGLPGTVTQAWEAASADSVFLSVRDFGAVGDNVTDDTASVQAGIDAVKITGGTLFFPLGTYKITGPLNFFNSQSRGITFKGIGGDGLNGSTLRYTALSGTVPMFKIYSSSSWRMEGLHFQFSPGFTGFLVDINGKGTGGSGADCQQWVIDQCYFDYSNQPFSGTCTGLLGIDNAVIGVVRDSRFIGAVTGIYLGKTQYVNVVELERNMFARMTVSGITIRSPDGEMITIRGNTFEDKARIIGLTGNALYKPLIEGNWFGDAGQNQIWIDGLVCQSSARIGTIRDNEFGGNSNDPTIPNIKLGDVSGSNQVGHWLIEGNDSLDGCGLGCYALTPASASMGFYVIGNTFANNLWTTAITTAGPETLFTDYLDLGNSSKTEYIPFIRRPSYGQIAGSSGNVGTKAFSQQGQIVDVKRGDCTITIVAHDFSATQYYMPVGTWIKLWCSNNAPTVGNPTIVAGAGVTLVRPTGTDLSIKAGGIVDLYKDAEDHWILTGDLVPNTTAFTLNAGATSHNLASGGALTNVEQTLRGLITDLQSRGIVK